eukprot:1810530-Karenia_brevis.AAC.1
MGHMPATAQYLGSGKVGQTAHKMSVESCVWQSTPPARASVHPNVGDVGLEGECEAHPPHRP